MKAALVYGLLLSAAGFLSVGWLGLLLLAVAWPAHFLPPSWRALVLVPMLGIHVEGTALEQAIILSLLLGAGLALVATYGPLPGARPIGALAIALVAALAIGTGPFWSPLVGTEPLATAIFTFGVAIVSLGAFLPFGGRTWT